MDKDALEKLIEFKQAESFSYARHLFWITQRTHAEIVAYCNRTISYPFDIERNAAAFVYLAGSVHNNLLNIVETVKPELKSVQKVWREQVLKNRAMQALVDRRDGLSHGCLKRWLLKADGGAAGTEEVKYPHMPVLVSHHDCTPIYFQWNDKHRVEFTDCLAWQEEVLQELFHQEHNHTAILSALRSGGDVTQITRLQLVHKTWNVESTSGESSYL